ncbi:adenylyl-sulfate kinase [Bacillus massilinigeriensis]|uniref:adenylyl-sulfate kinase n=1 Tax=Bacillus mediterraneensis TaxID=1805474 RepID=UPI0008F97024|nr:adenylyl-sulfate kinase [Bacillus mediterraneensis]
MKTQNITWHSGKLESSDRENAFGHKSCVLWMTGLSGSGKSTLAVEVERELFNRGLKTFHLDGDNLRFGLNRDLGFSEIDRKENIRRTGEVAKLFSDAGIITITSFISPYIADRETVRELIKEKFIEIYVKCSVNECERRDPKGLYKKARNGEIKGFTGIDAPYEEPMTAELIVETDRSTVKECVEKILSYLEAANII